MSWSRKELLVFGYIRSYCKEIKVQIPPKDVILMFVSWITFMDSFDRIKSHKRTEYISNTRCYIKKSATYTPIASIIGKIIVEKGMKQSWTFATDTRALIVGIIENDIVDSNEQIADFSDSTYKGYGMGLNGFSLYHAKDSGSDGSFNHAQQFKYEHLSPLIMTMELDLTQKENENGVLRFYVHHKAKKDVDKIRTDGAYSTIAWNDIDINKKYRVAFGLQAYGEGNCIELLPDSESL